MFFLSLYLSPLTRFRPALSPLHFAPFELAAHQALERLCGPLAERWPAAPVSFANSLIFVARCAAFALPFFSLVPT